jgi:hypothetical protein
VDDISVTKFLLLEIITAEEAYGMHQTQAVCGVISGCVWWNVLKPVTQHLISNTIKYYNTLA